MNRRLLLNIYNHSLAPMSVALLALGLIFRRGYYRRYFSSASFTSTSNLEQRKIMWRIRKQNDVDDEQIKIGWNNKNMYIMQIKWKMKKYDISTIHCHRHRHFIKLLIYWNVHRKHTTKGKTFGRKVGICCGGRNRVGTKICGGIEGIS